MSSAIQSGRVHPERFERLYEASPDPWGYCSSEYERQKYASTLSAIGTRSYGRVLEIGCSIGVFTELLAARCESVVAIDFSARALTLARDRLRSQTHIEVVEATFPERAPSGPWALVVCSEVLYYLDRRTLQEALKWFEQQLYTGAVVLAVSWRGPGRTEPLQGDEVHDLLRTRLGQWHTLDGRHARYRLDRFDGDGS